MSDYVALYASTPASHGEKIEFVIMDNADSASLEQWIASYNAAEPSHPEIKSTEPVLASDATGVRQVWSAEGVTAFAAYFALPGKVLLVNGPWVDSSILEEYEKVLASLKLNSSHLVGQRLKRTTLT